MAYLEIQVQNKKDFEIIRKYSDYSSVLTGVCSLSAIGVRNLNAKYPKILASYLDKDDRENLGKGIPKPTVVIKDSKIYVENGDIEILSFLDTRSLLNPEVKIVNLWKLFDLINSGILQTDTSFDNKMTEMDEQSPLKELITSTGRMRFRGKLWSLADLDGCTIKDLEFDKCEKVEKRFMTLKDLTVQEFYPDTKTVRLIKDGNPTPYLAKFFYVTPNMVNLLEKGRKVTLATEKAYGSTSKNEYKLVDPLILPRGHVMKRTVNLKCPRKYPTAIYNAAYAEYLYRIGRSNERS